MQMKDTSVILEVAHIPERQCLALNTGKKGPASCNLASALLVANLHSLYTFHEYCVLYLESSCG
jgi:hypothetical protein